MTESSRAWQRQISDQDHNETVTERISLLTAGVVTSYNHGTISNEAPSQEDEPESEIDENEFDHMVCVSESYRGGLGIEPESQQTAMLRGRRRYSTTRLESNSRKQSFASSGANTNPRLMENATPVEETDEGVEDGDKSKSPFMADVSVARFWLIFGCVLACYFVACFDSTVPYVSFDPHAPQGYLRPGT